MIRYHRVDKNRPPMFFALTMVALLVGGGEGTDALNSGLIGVDAIELGAASPELGSPPTQISPSVSAAQLLNDKTLTVGMAQAVAAGELVLPSETSQNIIAEQSSTDTESTPTESVATPTIDEATDTTSETDAVVVAPVVTPVAETTSPNLGAAIPTESVDEEEEAVAEQTPSGLKLNLRHSPKQTLKLKQRPTLPQKLKQRKSQRLLLLNLRLLNKIPLHKLMKILRHKPNS